MSIENILNGIDFKKIDSGSKWSIYKISSKINLYYAENNCNDFIMERDYFEYLDFNSLPYCLLLKDTSKNTYYFLDMTKGYNWIKSCFNSCDKDKLHLGKQVLNYKISTQDLMTKLKKFK